MPAIGLAAALLEQLDPDAVLGSFAADHVIVDASHSGLIFSDAALAQAAGGLLDEVRA